MSDDRKARLAALAARAGRIQHPISNSKDSGNDQDAGDGSKQPTLSFRNYVPKDASLDASAAPPASSGDGGGDQQLPKRRKMSENESSPPPAKSSALEAALAKTSRESREAAGQNVGASGGWAEVTPVSTKKVNWDLKRDVRHKMDFFKL